MAMWNLRKIRQIREYLDQDTYTILCCALVLSHLDYSNGILCEASDTVINKLQRVQNLAAKLVLCKGQRDSPRECLKVLHWLPIRARIEFKILCIVYKFSSCQGPEYLESLLCKNDFAKKGLRSEMLHNQLIVPRVACRMFAVRSFSVFGLKNWNLLPNNIRKSKDIESFKLQLKTYLYEKYLIDNPLNEFIYY